MSQPLTISAVAWQCKVDFETCLLHKSEQDGQISIHHDLANAPGKFNNGADNTPNNTPDNLSTQSIEQHHEIRTEDGLDDARRHFSVWADDSSARSSEENFEQHQAFEQRQETSIYHELEDSRGRFNVWADNIGALQAARSKKSLDSRLKDAPVMRSAFIAGLNRLDQSLTQVYGIFCGKLPNRMFDNDTLDMGQNFEPSTSELQELALIVSSSINHLFGLSVLVRRMRPKGRFHSLDTPIENPRDVVTVADKFPKVREQEWLAQRLGNATGRRRLFFNYRQQHRKRLATRTDAIEKSPDDNDDHQGECDIATTIATTFEENTDGDPSRVRQTALERGSIFTSATSLVSDYDQDQAMGRRIPDLPDMILDGRRLDYRWPIECPYCRTVQVFDNRLEWKRHVFSDLQPYVCTFEDCMVGLFPTRYEWIKHEMDSHRRRWKCIRCDGVKKEYTSESDMVTHLRQGHSDTITEDQASIILKVCEEPQTYFSSSECPLCSVWNPASNNMDNAKGFFRHLAQHQQQLALEALPLYIEGLEVEDPKEFKTASESGSDTEVPAENKEAKDSRTTRLLQEGKLFGVSLEILFERDVSPVNVCISKCINAIDKHGLSQKNIYQRSGSPEVIQALRNEFERDARSPSLDFDNPDNFFHNVDNIAGLLGRFFQELPDPLMTRDKYDLFIEAVREEDDEELCRNRLHAIINALPDAHYAALRAMVFHLGRVMKNSTTNQMNSSSLSKIFGPLFFGADIDVSESDLPWQIKVMKTILDCGSDIFNDDGVIS